MEATDQTLLKINHARLYKIWRKAQPGELIQDEEEAVLGKAMLEHEEFHTYWNRLPKINNAETTSSGVNPIVHISLHAAIENQIAGNDPPEVQKSLELLLKNGATRHEAVHAIGYEFIFELEKMMTTQRPFNNIAYIRRLNKLIGSK